jgi:LysR family transcriptional regulator, glycine cleavage system transcriptional activator
MYRHLPPLSALRVFEAAGRHESFTVAAGELCVTTSAVSRQIRALENELGMRLFERRPGGLKLTSEGAEYLTEVAAAFRRLEQASASLRSGGQRRVLRLSVLASFAGNWLVPRLPAFERAHPGIDLVMESGRDHQPACRLARRGRGHGPAGGEAGRRTGRGVATRGCDEAPGPRDGPAAFQPSIFEGGRLRASP